MPHDEPGGSARMTIEEFCRARGLSRSRVDRSARTLGWRAVAEQEGIPVHEAKDVGLKSVHLGPTEKKGVQVQSRAGKGRFSYRVLRREEFFGHLAEEHGADLLTGRDIRRLLRYARFLRNVIEGEAGYRLESKMYGDRERPDKDEMLGQLEELLRKAGWDPDRKGDSPVSS